MCTLIQMFDRIDLNQMEKYYELYYFYHQNF